MIVTRLSHPTITVQNTIPYCLYKTWKTPGPCTGALLFGRGGWVLDLEPMINPKVDAANIAKLPKLLKRP